MTFFRSGSAHVAAVALGDAAGLTKIGINYTTLGPGAASSMRHWHTQEDELVYVLAGELVLVTMPVSDRSEPGSARVFRRVIATVISSSIEHGGLSRDQNATKPTSRIIRTSICGTASGPARIPGLERGACRAGIAAAYGWL